MAAPGTADYFPALVSRIRTIAPNLPLEPVVLESVLLCLAAGSKNLILRTEDDDVGFVAKSVTSVSSHTACTVTSIQAGVLVRLSSVTPYMTHNALSCHRAHDA